MRRTEGEDWGLADTAVDWRRIDRDPSEGEVDQITFVLFLADGSCAAVENESGELSLPTGVVQSGESWLLDGALPIPLMTAGFRMQRVHPVALADRHLVVWIEGTVYRGRRPHVEVPLVIAAPEDLIARMRLQSPDAAELMSWAWESYTSMTDEDFYADTLRIIEPFYLRATTAEEGSGQGGGPEAWRAGRIGITEGIDADGTFLDVGCANGLLMESVQEWCADKGVKVEPYGIDLAPGLVALARSRLPRWAERFWVGNAISWVHPEGMTFDYVHTLLDCVPRARRADLVAHHLETLVRPGGRLLVSSYEVGSTGVTVPDLLESYGYTVAGTMSGRPDGSPPHTAWVVA